MSKKTVSVPLIETTMSQKRSLGKSQWCLEGEAATKKLMTEKIMAGETVFPVYAAKEFGLSTLNKKQCVGAKLRSKEETVEEKRKQS